MNNKTKVGDIIELQKQDVEVIECKDCGTLMVNIDADQVAEGDLITLKRKGVRLSNPETKDPICLKCEVEKKPTFRDKINDWFDDDEDDDDSGFFHYTPSPSPSRSSTPIFGGSRSGGGFGGFGGGVFSGGGASRGF
jgi:uncharacterized membrane protein YgcG